MKKLDLRKRVIHGAVRAAYGAIARRAARARSAAGCCTDANKKVADYSPAELAAVPPGAFLGEGSGVPTRYAELPPGGVVVDLGSGAGMDSFLAANTVGPSGRVYGFDLTPAMVERARENAVAGGYVNVTFEQADIVRLPLAADTADAVISNCLINLAPDKPVVFREAFRVLRPGGRLSIADIVLRGNTQAIGRFRKAAGFCGWVACVSGALHEQDYLEAIRAAGFADVRVVAERPARFQLGGVQAVAVTVTARKLA